MKSLYIVTITNSQNRMVKFSIIATSMAAAVTKAQTEAGVTSDPATVQMLEHIDLEVA